MIKHIWFDMGGTLYRETPAFKAERDALKYKAYAEIVGETDLAMVVQEYDTMYARYGSNSAVFTALGKPSDFWQQTFENMDLSEVIVPDPHVRATVTSLSHQVPVSLFTNFKLKRIQKVLELLSIDVSIFTHMLSGDDVTKRKPDLEGFMKMVQLSALPAGEVLYVGDRVNVDIKPAKSIGMHTCLVYATSNEADYSAPTFAALQETIRLDLPPI